MKRIKYNIVILDEDRSVIYQDKITILGVGKSRLRAIKIIKSEYESRHGTIMQTHSIQATII